MLTQKDASELFGTNTDTWSRWEKDRDPKLDKVIEIATYFDVGIADLLLRDLEVEGIRKASEASLDQSVLEQILIKKEITIHEKEERIRRAEALLAEAQSGGKEDTFQKMMELIEKLGEMLPDEVWLPIKAEMERELGELGE